MFPVISSIITFSHLKERVMSINLLLTITLDERILLSLFVIMWSETVIAQTFTTLHG